MRHLSRSKMNRMSRSTAHLLVLDETTIDRAISSLELMIENTHQSGAMQGLLKQIVNEYRLTKSKLDAAEQELRKLNDESSA